MKSRKWSRKRNLRNIFHKSAQFLTQFCELWGKMRNYLRNFAICARIGNPVNKFSRSGSRELIVTLSMKIDCPSWLQSPESFIPRGCASLLSAPKSGIWYWTSIIDARGKARGGYSHNDSLICLRWISSFFNSFSMPTTDQVFWAHHRE